MPKHHRIWNASVYDDYVREGRGRGNGSGYAPWIYIQDFASRGVVSRVKGRTTGRVHHLMSNNELAYFYILDWSDAVTDIREQYPLSDLECAVSVAAQAGIKYPIDHISGYPYVLTCDFMITTRGETKARTIKTTIDLNNRRTIDKLEIERRYWITKGVDWKIITEQNISFQKAKNIEWLYMAQDFCIPSEFEHARHMMMQLLLYGRYSVLDAVKTVENEYALATGSGIQLFKQLVLDKAITINLDESLNLNEKGVAV
jgi:hypothetical protein